MDSGYKYSSRIFITSMSSRISIPLTPNINARNGTNICLYVETSCIPLTYYNVYEDIFITFFDSLAAAHNLLINAGQYDQDSFSTLLINQMNATETGAITYSYNGNNFKITIVASGPATYSLFFVNNPIICKIFGVETEVLYTSIPASGLLTFPNAYNFIRTCSYLLTSNVLSNIMATSYDNIYDNTTLTKRNDIIFVLPLVHSYTGLVSNLYEGNIYTRAFLNNFINHIELELRDSHGVLLELNGQCWTISLIAKYN